MHHTVCDHDVDPVLTCGMCGKRVHAGDLDIAWGPSGSWARPYPSQPPGAGPGRTRRGPPPGCFPTPWPSSATAGSPPSWGRLPGADPVHRHRASARRPADRRCRPASGHSARSGCSNRSCSRDDARPGRVPPHRQGAGLLSRRRHLPPVGARPVPRTRGPGAAPVPPGLLLAPGRNPHLRPMRRRARGGGSQRPPTDRMEPTGRTEPIDRSETVGATSPTSSRPGQCRPTSPSSRLLLASVAEISGQKPRSRVERPRACSGRRASRRQEVRARHPCRPSGAAHACSG